MIDNYPPGTYQLDLRAPWNVPDAVYCESCEEEQVQWDGDVPRRLCKACEDAEQ